MWNMLFRLLELGCLGSNPSSVTSSPAAAGSWAAPGGDQGPGLWPTSGTEWAGVRRARADAVPGSWKGHARVSSCYFQDRFVTPTVFSFKHILEGSRRLVQFVDP